MKGFMGKLTRMGVLSALSVVLMLVIRFPIIPAASFLEYEPADVPILIGALLYGPVAGLIMTVVVSVVQFLTVSANSGWVGLVMHMIATGTLAVTAGVIYRFIPRFKGAVLAVLCGSLAMTLIMIPANLFFTVKFYGYPIEAVRALLPTGIIPFNLIKSVANSILVLLLYKPLACYLTAPKAEKNKC
ncbi:MAG TPA: ECF transporter S component [Clostridiales bacterium]|nr:ECF transporter S component [Clostridiales bacterium]